MKSGFGFVEEERDMQKLQSKGFGEYFDGFFLLNLYEIGYLLEKKRIKLLYRKKFLNFDEFSKKREFNFYFYLVFKDLRDRGFHLGSGSRYGAIFRVYERGVRKEASKKSREHSKWLLFIRKYSENLSGDDIASMNRIANSTKKNVLLAIIDNSGKINYYEFSWKRMNK